MDNKHKKDIAAMLKEHPGGFSVAPDGSVTADREAVELKSIDQFSDLVREPNIVTIDLHGGKRVRFKVRPLGAAELREIDEKVGPAPLPPMKDKPRSPSIAKGAPGQNEGAMSEYDWQSPEYRKKLQQHSDIKRAAVIAKGLVGMEVPGDTLDKKAAYLAEHFTNRILDGIRRAIDAMSSDPLEQALFSSSLG